MKEKKDHGEEVSSLPCPLGDDDFGSIAACEWFVTVII